MSQSSSAFHLLDERIQRFIWAEGWAALRDAQEAAIPLILPADRDVLISAATAAGKTEAAFLPALTHLLQHGGHGLNSYVSPLKALINDQFGRLEQLCAQLDVPVWPWHGDVTATRKARFRQEPRGVLLITPESLEAMLCLRGSSVASLFSGLLYAVVDELHAFIGTERGKQLQSLLHRLERAIDRTVPRIALSATLGDMTLAAGFLRPDQGEKVARVESAAAGNGLKILLKGYQEPATIKAVRVDQADEDAPEPVSPRSIAAHLFKLLRGSNNLVFPNSRREVERYTHLLRDMCDEQQVPCEFWPHHGSLSKEIRFDTEAALKQTERPATAICTNTLELGIDLGAVRSVVQIGPPPSVASLRQRLGRSGRRPGEPAILVGYCIEQAPDQHSSFADELRLDTLRMIATISLLLERWFEPPPVSGMHLSTLVQQILSVVAQHGGATIGQLYHLLCGSSAPFAGLSRGEFSLLVRQLGQQELLMQDSSGVLLHGRIGERVVQHYSFYTAFTTDEEFKLVSRGRPLGTLPVAHMLRAKQRILFAGRTWRVDEIDEAAKTIFVTPARGGMPPSFNGGAGRVHTRVRQRIRELLAGQEMPAYLDAGAIQLLGEARAAYARRELGRERIVDQGREILLLTWLGDDANEALACLLRTRGHSANAAGPGVEIDREQGGIAAILRSLASLAHSEPPALDVLLADAANLRREKWDWALPDSLLQRSYASLQFDLATAMTWLRQQAGAAHGHDRAHGQYAQGDVTSSPGTQTAG